MIRLGGSELKLMDIRVQKGPKEEGAARSWLPAGTPWRHGGHTCLAGDEHHS